jgi:2-polyprenyl-3-methyl-5-hydroxy-6-metoxy-1,4-benzoquinol methylase|tara:strand:- start:752 stop:1372 length:621 start_codon:yes stop_codon:yes gene_type:complete
MPSDETLNAFYDNYHKSAQYLSKLDSKIRRAKKRIRSVNWFKKPGKFIDVGCNVGFAVEAARLLGFDANGIDIDANAIEVAKEQFSQANFSVRSVQDLAECGEKFDFIYCSEVIEHLPELESFFAALVKCLTKDGLLYITTPDNGHFSLPNEFSKLVDWTSIRPPEHLMYFTKSSVAPLLSRHGLNSVKIPFSFKPTLKIIAKVKG